MAMMLNRSTRAHREIRGVVLVKRGHLGKWSPCVSACTCNGAGVYLHYGKFRSFRQTKALSQCLTQLRETRFISVTFCVCMCVRACVRACVCVRGLGVRDHKSVYMSIVLLLFSLFPSYLSPLPPYL